ncbi:MAG: hypothetical protein ACFFB0_09925 [Promethearchaeota archaeon]
MKNKQHLKLIIILFLIFSIFSSALSILIEPPSVRDKEYFNIENENYITPHLAGPSLNYSSIDINRSRVYRLFEAVNISVNVSGYRYADYAYMEISFTNGTHTNYTMDPAGSETFYVEYTPTFNAPLGLQNVSFYIFNASGTLLNAHKTYSNFSIRTNYMMNFNSTEYYVGDTLNAELTLVNITGFNFFRWDITIVDDIKESTQKNLFDLERNLYQFAFKITNETFNELNKIYYIKVNISDSISGKKYATYFPFNVLNSNPNIIRDSIEFSPETVLRTEKCTILLNVTDSESSSDSLSITAEIEDPNGRTLPSVSLSHRVNDTYRGSFTIPADFAIGRYNINITAKDPIGGFSSFLTFLTVENNMPEIHSYEINGMSRNKSISILYGKNLVFTFNVSDVEGVAFIKVALLGANNNWFNITRAYNVNDTRITIRTIDLISGIWYVYIYVFDSDGAVTSLIDDYDMAPQAIRIIPDVISAYVPWIAFSIGLLLGVIASIGGIHKYFKSKFIASEEMKSKKTKETTKKSLILKKEKQKPIIEEMKQEQAVGLEEKEEKEKIPKRKIKRKL